LQLLRLIYKFILYRLKSFRLHGIHSPFVFDLYQQVICHNGHYAAYNTVEKLRRTLKRNHKKIEVTDWGAGSRTNALIHRRISELARVSAKPSRYAQLLFRLINYFQPDIMVELGTSLGITTAYLASARKNGKIFTFEGCSNITQLAQRNFNHLGLSNITLVPGNMDQTLAAKIVKLPQVDFVYFDGNHRYEPTMRYFNICLQKHTENSIFVFDDIYWSREMEKAWLEICSHSAVTLSIDLFQMGFVFFRKKQPKQHFTIWL